MVVVVVVVVGLASTCSDLTVISASVLIAFESTTLSVNIGSIPTLLDSVVGPSSRLPSDGLDSSGRETSLNDAEEGTGKETGNNEAEGKFIYAEALVFDRFIGEEESLEWVYSSRFC